MRTRNLGKKSADEIARKLNAAGVERDPHGINFCCKSEKSIKTQIGEIKIKPPGDRKRNDGPEPT